MSKRLIKNSKLTNRQINKLIDFFVLEVPAPKSCKAVKINRHSAERIYQIIRFNLAIECEKHNPFNGEIEIDESYFGGKRKGNHGRGAAGKIPVFGSLKRNGWVYTRIVNDVSRNTLRKIIKTRIVPKSIIYSDSFRSYNGLVLDGFKHYRINHDKTFVSSKRHHINGIESFWGYAKTKLRKYHGIDRKRFYYYLKEMEFRFNYRKHPNFGLLIRKIVKKNNRVLD
ncbi:IS1595 family transposase [Patescibacteria group bacterium]|nr:IS1595 family transposase [Patescibacteria group bacterium]MBU4512218.1 IS1595 family transposase [Patescibacteria group bacterium]MCG2692636.1 IS1595 family transposase [Candidatus Parcubacteria bacterium]